MYFIYLTSRITAGGRQEEKEREEEEREKEVFYLLVYCPNGCNGGAGLGQIQELEIPPGLPYGYWGPSRL